MKKVNTLVHRILALSRARPCARAVQFFGGLINLFRKSAPPAVVGVTNFVTDVESPFLEIYYKRCDRPRVGAQML